MRISKGYLIILLLAALAMVLASCGGSGTGVTTGSSGSSKTTTIAGKVALSSASSSSKPTPAIFMKAGQMAEKASRSYNKARHEKTSLALASYKASMPGVPQFSMEEVYQKAGLASAIIIGDVSLYDADHPEWLFPVSESKFNPDGSYFLNTTANATLNSLFANTVDYTDGQPVPAGKYTLIAKTDQTLTGELLIGVQAVVKEYVGDVTGNDLVIQDSDALPSVISMFGYRPNLDGNFGGANFVVPTNGAVQVTFSMAMARLSILSGGIDVSNVTNSSIGIINGTWKISPNLLSATFYPDAYLEFGDTYVVKVKGADEVSQNVKNVYGKTMTKSIFGTFKVGPEDVTAPEAIRISPTKEVKADMPITTPLRIAADEPLDLNTIEVASSPSIGVKPNVIFIGKSLLGTNYPFIYEIVPSEPFDLNKTYLVTVSGAKDLARNNMIDLTFNFTTEKTSAGIDPNAPAIVQDTQADVKDVFGKWIRAFDDRSIQVLTSYMSGDFLWAGGGGSEDLNRDGLLSLGEFSDMLSNFFIFLEGCDSDVTGAVIGNIVVSDSDATDLAPYDRATMMFTITTKPNNTTNTMCTSESGPSAEEILTANLELRNGSWIIVSGADPGHVPPTGTHRLINLVSPADNYVMPTTNPPTMIWNGIDGVSTYAVIMLSARADRTGWVALVNSDGLDTNADKYEVTYTPDLGYADGLKVNGLNVPKGIYTLCNYENEQLCGGRLQRYFEMDRRINTGMKEGSNINWSVIGLGALNTTELITDGIGQSDVADDVVAAADSRFFSVAGEWKELTVTVVAKSGGTYAYSPYVGGYDVGSADSVVVIINAPTDWANGSGTFYHSGLDYKQYPLSFDTNAQARVDLNLYNKGNWISLDAYKPGAQTEAGRLYKNFNILTTGGIPPGLEIDTISDFSNGTALSVDEWGNAASNSVKSVNIYGHRNDATVVNVRLNVYANNGRYNAETAVDGSGNFSFINVPVFEGWNSLYVQDTDYQNQIARDYASIEVTAPGGSVFVHPIQFLGGAGLTMTQTSMYSVTYDAGSLSTANFGVAMVANLGDAGPPNYYYAGWYENTCDPNGYSCTSTGYRGTIFPDGSWERYDPSGFLNGTGASISSIQLDLFKGSNNIDFYDEFWMHSRSMIIITTSGKIYVPPINASFTTTSPVGATATSKYVSGNSSDWDTDAESIDLSIVMNKLGVGTTYQGGIDHYLSTDTDWVRVGYTIVNAGAAGQPLGSWQNVDPNSWQPLAGISNQGASIANIPVDLYKGQNVFYINDGNSGYYYLYVTTTVGSVFTPDISNVTAYDGPFTPGAVEVVPDYSTSSYASYQTDVNSVTLWVESRYDDTWPLDGSNNMINGIAYRHNAQGVWQTYYADLDTNGNNLSPTFELINGNNNIDICYKPVPDPYDPNYIQSCSFWYNVYMTTTGGSQPPQWIYVDTPAHDIDIPFDALINVQGHIDNSSDAFTPNGVYAYLINTTSNGSWDAYAYFSTGYPSSDPRYMSYDPGTMAFSFKGQFYQNLPQTIYISACGLNELGENKCHYSYSYVNNIYGNQNYSGKPSSANWVPSVPMTPEMYFGIPRDK